MNEFPTALQQIRKSCSNNKRFKHFIKVCTQTTDPSIQVRMVVDYITLSNIHKFNESSVFCCDVQMCADAPVQYQKAAIGNPNIDQCCHLVVHVLLATSAS